MRLPVVWLAMASTVSASSSHTTNALSVLEAALASIGATSTHTTRVRVAAATPTCTGTVREYQACPSGCSSSNIGGAFGVVYSCYLPAASTTTAAGTAPKLTTSPTSTIPVESSLRTPIPSSSDIPSTCTTEHPSPSTSTALTTSLPSALSTVNQLSSTSIIPQPTASTDPPAGHHDFMHSKGMVALFATIGFVSFFSIVGLGMWFFMRRARNNEGKDEDHEMNRLESSQAHLSGSTAAKSVSEPKESNYEMPPGGYWPGTPEQNRIRERQLQQYHTRGLC